MKDIAINEITIKNFKCFKDIRLEGLQRVNLIGGKNNIGKTSFMEAVELLVSSSNINDLVASTYKMIKRRQKGIGIRSDYFELDFIHAHQSKLEIKSDKSCFSIEYQEEPTLL
ncbi:MAG: AAA family ATPase, partial [Methyloprofundus sp.]|nr:AAA family ATPase [Methyloprofundus sp.]